MSHTQPGTRHRGAIVTGALALVGTLLLAGCSAAGPSNGTPQDAKGKVVVWVDGTRQPEAAAYAKANPTANLDIVTVDSSQLESKISLLARDPGSLPDVVFTPNGQGVDFASKYGYSQDLSTLVSSKVKDGYGALLGSCKGPDGALDCLPFDISTQMLFYNKTLFDKFGYTVPTTWDQYAALGAQVAKDHPGYVIGSCGDNFCPNVFYHASGCQGIDLQKGTLNASVVLATDPKCTRVTSMLDPLIADKSMATLSPFDPDMATLGTADKILMMPGFVWYGSLLFQQTFKNANGTIAVAPLPAWSDGVRGVGASLGGQWVVGSKSAHQAAAVKLIVAMSTDPKYLASQVTFPAYQPAAAGWIKQAAASGFYAEDPTKTFEVARSDIHTSLEAPAGFDILGPFGNAVAPKLKAGSTLDSEIDPWADAVKQSLSDSGYNPTIKK